MVFQRQNYMERKEADRSLTLERANVWLQNMDDPGSAVLSDRATAELIIPRLCKVQPWRRSKVCRSACFPNTHSNASPTALDKERLSAVLKIPILLITFVSKNIQRQRELKIVVFWDCTHHSNLVTVCRRFGGTWYPHPLQTEIVCFFEKKLNFSQATRRHNKEQDILYGCCREKANCSYKVAVCI